MITIKATGSISDMIRSVRDIPEKQVKFAAAKALTRVAQELQKKVIPDEMRRVFDRPTAYALDSLFIKSATPDKLLATVAIKHVAGNSAIPSEKFILPQVMGGVRREKRFEKALRFAGLMLPGQSAIVAKSSEMMDAHGNISGGKITQLLSYFNAFAEQGYRMNMSDKRRGQLAKRGRGKKNVDGQTFAKINGVEYFAIVGKRGSHLHAGIYSRKGTHGSNIKPVLIFGDRPASYTARLDWEGVNRKAIEQIFPIEFKKALSETLAGKMWA